MKNILLFTFLAANLTITAQFTLITGTPFDGVKMSSIAVSDIDNDNDQDVLITGKTVSNLDITKLYTNDGNGGFTEVIGIPFEQVHEGSTVFFDIDNDNDQDVLIAGEDNFSQKYAKLYTNNGNGIFTELTGTPFTPFSKGSIAIADIDNDNDHDVLITGRNSLNQPMSKLYQNNLGVFTEVTGTPFDAVDQSAMAFSDVDNDNDQDILITGFDGSQRITKLYTNNGVGVFTEVLGTPFDGVSIGSISFSDVDNDNDQDVLITGHNGTQAITKLYANNGLGVFTEIIGTPFTAVYGSYVAFSDIDNDNDQDLLITGFTSSATIAKLYTNNGSGVFTQVSGTPFLGTNTGSVAFFDIDNDNDQDVLITGNSVGNIPSTRLYENNSIITDLHTGDVNTNDISIFPNPTHGKVNIKLPNINGTSIRIYNALGQLVNQQLNIVSQDIHFNFEATKGLYILELTQGKTHSKHKLIIE